MSIKLTALTTIFAVVILYIVLDYGIHRYVIFPSYQELEKFEAMEDIQRCLRALEQEIQQLDMFANDWAAWDDTYRFIKKRNMDYIASNLGHQTFVDNRLNAIWICGSEGEMIWAKSIDLDTGTTLSLLDLGYHRLAAMRHQSPDSSIAGVHMTAKGPLLVASRPVITSSRSSEIRGSLIMGRLLTKEIVDRLIDRTQVEHQIFPIVSQSPLPEHVQKAIDQIKPDQPVFQVTHKSSLTVYATVQDLDGASALLIRASIPRNITAKGTAAMKYAFVSNSITGLLLLSALFVLFQRIVKPISDLTLHAVAIRDTGDLSRRYKYNRNDEIGLLIREFDRMVDQLHSTHQNLEALVAAKTADLRSANQLLQKEVEVRKQVQTALHEAHNRLEIEVENRTAELTETNLQLTREIEERRQAEVELKNYHRKLRLLSSQLLLAEERERRRIASELHDRIGQTLTISMIQIDALRELLTASEVGDRLESIGSLIDQIIQDTRQLTFELSPPVLYELGLEPALEWLVEQFQDQHGLVISFKDDSQPKPTSDSNRVLLFQACRELLFNIVKHANANRVVVSIKRSAANVEIVIADDGRGFDTHRVGFDNTKHGGFGLFSIRERLHHIGGCMNITSDPGKGTRICLLTPLKSTRRSINEKN